MGKKKRREWLKVLFANLPLAMWSTRRRMSGARIAEQAVDQVGDTVGVGPGNGLQNQLQRRSQGTEDPFREGGKVIVDGC